MSVVGRLLTGLVVGPGMAISLSAAFAQEPESAETTQPAQVYGGPGANFGAIATLDPNVKVTIVPPKSVVIGKGVTIGEGVLIEGKPWVNVLLPDGRTGYVSGSAICTRIEGASVNVGLCPPQ